MAQISRAIGMKGFGDRLREARTTAGMTQEQLGFALGVTKASISAWENGRETPSFRVLPELRSALRLSLDELICGVGATSATKPHDVDAAELRAGSVHERTLLFRFRALPAKKREAFLEILKP